MEYTRTTKHEIWAEDHGFEISQDKDSSSFIKIKELTEGGKVGSVMWLPKAAIKLIGEVFLELAETENTDGWITHKFGDPMPCMASASVRIRSRDGYEDTSDADNYHRIPLSKSWWNGPDCDEADQIIAWKFA